LGWKKREMITALTNGVLIDSRGGGPQPDTTVVDDKRIAGVSQRREFGADVRVVYLRMPRRLSSEGPAVIRRQRRRA
jgi:hypothetical protein